jgi:hypothetical protein
MRVFNIGKDTKVFGVINDLTIYSSNFAELKYSKVKYRVNKKNINECIS